jgi:gluconokinase
MASDACRVLVVLGVSGAGKTTVGRELARQLGYEFLEGDDFHSQANKDKMHAGIALTDEDREPWLAALRQAIERVLANGGRAVLACSALKRAYRDELRMDGVCFVYLRVSRAEVRARLAHRGPHFFNPELLDSQFATLEEPTHALIVDATGDVSTTVRAVRAALSDQPSASGTKIRLSPR